jgi:hypothetical protein
MPDRDNVYSRRTLLENFFRANICKKLIALAGPHPPHHGDARLGGVVSALKVGGLSSNP